MNLQENISRIHQMMGVINENKVVDIINELGLINTIRYLGGYDKVKKLIGNYEFSNEEKIRFIKDVVKHYSEEHNSGGIHARILNMNPIFYGISDDDETQQMEYFTPNEVIIDVYNDDDTYFTEKYEHLDDTILDNVFLFMVDVLK